MKKFFRILRKILLVLFVILVVVIIGGLLFLLFYPGVGKLPGREQRELFAQKTPLFSDGKFHNENDFELLTGKWDKKSSRRTPDDEIPVIRRDHIERAGEGELRVTWLGHSSSLIQMGAVNILMDPVLTTYSSPVSFVGSKRFSEVALKPEDVPEIDVLFLSHDHYDHMDYQTLKVIRDRVKEVVVPLGVDTILLGWGFEEEHVHALAWWESVTLNGITFTLTPGQHYSGRNPLRNYATLWGGVHFAYANHSVYYTGDTGYYDVFERVHEKFGEIDLMLVEDGQYDKGWSQCHMFPEESAQAIAQIAPKQALPVHWGAFCLGNHSWDDPIIRLTKEAERLGLPLTTPKIGETVEFDDLSNHREHWWEGIE